MALCPLTVMQDGSPEPSWSRVPAEQVLIVTENDVLHDPGNKLTSSFRDITKTLGNSCAKNV